jgi:hypothetical protein
MLVQLASLGLLALGSVRAQDDSSPPLSTFPHNYTGMAEVYVRPLLFALQGLTD